MPKPKLRNRSSNKISERHKYPPLDGKWGWMVVLGASLGHFFSMGLARTLGVFFVHWKEMFQGSDAATAWVQSLFNTVRMCIGPVIGMLCDVFGPRVVVITGGFIFGAGCLISAFATSLGFLYLTFSLLGGLGAGCLLTTMFVMVSQYFDKKKGVAMALASIGAGLGTMVFAPLETVLLKTYGNYGAMLIISGLMLNCVVVGALFRPIESKLNWYKKKTKNVQQVEANMSEEDDAMELKDDKTNKQEEKPLVNREEKDAERENEKTEAEKTKTGDKEQDTEIDKKDDCSLTDAGDKTDITQHDDKSLEPKSKWSELKKRFLILKSATFWIYCFYIGALPCVVQIYLTFTPPLMKERGFTKNQVALVISIAGAADMAGRLISGFIFDLGFIRRRRWPTQTIYGFITAVIVLCNAFQRHMFGFITMALLWGIFEGGYHSQRATIMSEFITREQVSSSVGFMIFWQGIGNIVSPTFAGFLSDWFGTYTVCFYYGGTTMMVCSLAFFINYIIVRAQKQKMSKSKKHNNKTDA